MIYQRGRGRIVLRQQARRDEMSGPRVVGAWSHVLFDQATANDSGCEMVQHPPRCPACATTLHVSLSAMQKLLGLSPTVKCPTCARVTDARAAQVMGDAYGQWGDQVTDELRKYVEGLPFLSDLEMRKSLATRITDEDIKIFPTLDGLLNYCLRFFRGALVELAHGRRAQVEVAHVLEAGTPVIAVVSGRASAESGDKEKNLLIARVGKHQYVVYQPQGEDPRIKEAIAIKHYGAKAMS